MVCEKVNTPKTFPSEKDAGFYCKTCLTVVCCPLQLSLEELAKHKRLTFRPPEPAQSTQKPDHMTAADRRQVEEDAPEEDATDSDGSEENDVGAEENAHTQVTHVERGTLTEDATQGDPTVKNKRFDLKAEDMEETTEAPR